MQYNYKTRKSIFLLRPFDNTSLFCDHNRTWDLLCDSDTDLVLYKNTNCYTYLHITEPYDDYVDTKHYQRQLNMASPAITGRKVCVCVLRHAALKIFRWPGGSNSLIRDGSALQVRIRWHRLPRRIYTVLKNRTPVIFSPPRNFTEYRSFWGRLRKVVQDTPIVSATEM